MAKCKDCLHHDACKKIIIASFPTIPAAEVEKVTNRECDCKTFKPAADVVEVVRCKDCKHYKAVVSTCGNCYRTTCIQHTEDFCSYGKRKEETT